MTLNKVVLFNTSSVKKLATTITSFLLHLQKNEQLTATKVGVHS